MNRAFLLLSTMLLLVGCGSDESVDQRSDIGAHDPLVVFEEVGGTIEFDYERDENGTYTRAPRPATLSLANVKKLYLYDSSPPIDDHHLRLLEGMVNLELLNVTGSNITDEGLRHVAHLSLLRKVYLGDTDVTDAGLDHLSQIATLETIAIPDSDVPDRGLMKLIALPKLEYIQAWNSSITPVGKQEFERMKPGCIVDLVKGPGS